MKEMLKYSKSKGTLSRSNMGITAYYCNWQDKWNSYKFFAQAFIHWGIPVTNVIALSRPNMGIITITAWAVKADLRMWFAHMIIYCDIPVSTVTESHQDWIWEQNLLLQQPQQIKHE